MSMLRLFMLFNLLTMMCTKSNHMISRRSLLFPRATVLQFTYGISAPAILPRRSINLSLGFQANYNLPYNLTHLLQTRIIAAKGSTDGYDISRASFYERVVRFLDGFRLHGEQCLCRLICEMAEHPMRLDHAENLLEKIAHFLFTPSFELSESFSANFTSPYLEAEILGKREGECGKKYSRCPISLIDLFTNKFMI